MTSTDQAKDQAKAQLDSIREMVQALNDAGDDDEKREKAVQTIHENPLSVEVRSGWYPPNDKDADKAPAEYRILLCWGGPACQIVGALSEHGEPDTARIEYQDWGTPWTEYRISREDQDVLLSYARQFYFGE